MASPDDTHGASLQITVVYALPEEQHSVMLTVRTGATVEEAVSCSGLLQRFADIGSRPLQCAIFNRAVSGKQVLRSGDRVEILRPLRVDPKEQRRREAARTRAARGKRS